MRNESGYTLVELMAVVAIIVVLSGVGNAIFHGYMTKALLGSTKGNLATVRAAWTIYYGDIEMQPDQANMSDFGARKYFPEGIPTLYLRPEHPDTHVFVQTPDTDLPGWQVASKCDECDWDVYINCTHTDSKGQAWNTY